MHRSRLTLLGSGQTYQGLLLKLQAEPTLWTIEAREHEPEQSSLAPDVADLLIVATDAWDGVLEQQVNQHCLRAGQAWLGISSAYGSAQVGPLVVPGEGGCSTCALTRRRNAQASVELFAQSCQALRERGRGLHAADCWLTALAIQQIVALTEEEIKRFLHKPARTRLQNAFWQIELHSLSLHLHHFLTEPACQDCSGVTHLLVDDSDDLARLTLHSQRKLAASTYRVRSLVEEKAELSKRYVSAQAGMIRSLTKDSSNLFANMVVTIQVQNGTREEVGIGRALDFEQSYVSAVAEALERHGGMKPGGKRTRVRASYRELGEQALDPRLLGIYTPEQYQLPGFPYVPYSDDLVFNWVWGYAFQARRPILVPEQCVYYGLAGTTGERPFVYEISNGCALGGCLEEAILHGLLEVAERDAFLMTWYARLPAPRIDPASARDPLIPLLIERIGHLTGYRVHAFNITLEQGIPCFWVMAVDEQQRADLPRAVCAAGSHLHPEKALINALQELAPIVGQQMHTYPHERERALEMLDHPYRVAQMHDHSLLYGLPEAFERLAFLYGAERQQTFAEAFAQSPPTLDLLEDLRDLLARYASCGIETIVVDQTTPEQRLSDLRCVKVLLPGTLPMTFGHHARRIWGFPRLSRLPQQLGYRSSVLRDAEINPHPHPFP